MIETIVDRELSDAWSATGATESDDEHDSSGSTVEPVAVHEDGPELYVQVIDDMWLVNLSQRMQFDGISADVVTEGQSFEDNQQVARYINTICDAIDDGTGVIKPLAIVPHDGTIESIAVDGINSDKWTTAPNFADVFVLYPANLPDKISVGDIAADKEDIVRLVYGKQDEVPESMRTLNNTNEAFGSATVDVFTITGLDIELDE